MKILVRFLYTHLPCPGVSPKLLDEGFWIQDAEEDCGIRQYQTHKAVGLWPHEARSSYLISSDNQDIYVQKGSKEIFRKWKSKRHTVPWYLPFGELWCFFFNCTFLLNLGVCWWWAPKRTKSIGQVFVGLRLYPWQYIKKIMELYRDAKTEERDAFPAVPQQMAMDMVLYLHSGCWWYLMLLHIWVVGNH